MLRAVATGFGSPTYELRQVELVLARMLFAFFNPRCEITIDRTHYVVELNRRSRQRIEMRRGEEMIASAEMSGGATSRCFVVVHGESEYLLESQSLFQSEWLLSKGESRIGAIRREHLLDGHKYHVDLPADMPLVVQSFLTCLAVGSLRWSLPEPSWNELFAWIREWRL